MREVRLIEVKEDIHADNKLEAEKLRTRLADSGTFMLNLMSAPGSGKTSTILKTVEALGAGLRCGIIEADIDSTVDAEKMLERGIEAIQLRTGGFCHLDATMVKRGLEQLDLSSFDLVIIENVGNLVCPAEFDTGAIRSAMIVSVPEGDDKPLKYPLMFSVCDALLVNKIDYLGLSDFNPDLFRERALNLNSDIAIFEISAKTGEGVQAWADWLRAEVKAFKTKQRGA